MRTRLLRGAEDTTILLVYPSSADEYRQALRTLGGSAAEAGELAPEPAECPPARAAYVVTAARQRHLWNLPDFAVSGRCAVVAEARALELLQEAARRPGAAAGLFSWSPAGAGSKSPTGPSGESSIAAVRRVLTRGGADVDRAVRSGLDAAGLPAAAREALSERLADALESGADRAETEICRAELVLGLPWSVSEPQRFDRDHVARALDGTHSALDGVKERIVQFLAWCPEARDLLTFEGPCSPGCARTPARPALVVRPKPAGPRASALCLTGPPGTGKSSLARAVARALGRTCVNASLGGSPIGRLIRGAMSRRPGRVVEGIREAGVNNPVFILEAIDRVADDDDDVDPVLALLDARRRADFRDAHLGVPFDLSSILWIATATDAGAIPGRVRDRMTVLELPSYTEREKLEIPPPLRDRLEVVELRGYTEAEKLAIARSHLVPVENRAAGLVPAPVDITDGALREIVRRHTREPGIRQFNRCIKAVCRKVALGRETGDAALDRGRVTVREVRRWLGSGAGAEDGLDRLSRRLAARGVPSAVALKGRQVFERLSVSGGTSTDPEHVRSREYLECLAELPWNMHAVSKLDLAQVRATLDERHAGLADVKERLIDHVAVHVLNPDLPAPVLCLRGREGVGKTSLARAFAAALGRPCAWVECGELVDAAALLGEARRGPGRVVQELRRVGARNPVIVFDQLDRLSDRGGLPTALLELFDAGARQRFRDRYVGHPVDLSGASVVATATRLREVPSMLCERMAVVDVPGYTPEDKKVVAARHLLPAAARLYGLADGDLELTDDAVLAVVRGYAPEPGLWSLLDASRTLCRKVARGRAEGDGSKAVITPEMVAAMLGTPTFIEMDVADRMGRPGVAVALGWTAYGGDVMFVEAGRMPGAGGLTLTGSLDDELKESILTALSWLRANARRYRLDEAVFRQTDLHVHVQSLADSRRGGSAGVGVAAALASSFTGRPVRSDVALTGELTLSGHVLPVAGIKEKVLGAVRRGLTRLVVPRQNVPHFEESVADDLRRRITVHAVSRVDEALDLVLGPASSAVDVAEEGEPIARGRPVAEDLVRSGAR